MSLRRAELNFLKVKAEAIPGEDLRFPGGWGSQISRPLAHKGGKVASHTH